MAEYEGIKLNPDNQLLLEGPSLRLPYELSRRNLKTAQKHIEKERDYVLNTMKTLVKNVEAGKQSKEQTLAQFDSMINRVTGLKRKLEELEAERKELDRQAKARIEHLEELWNIPTVSDVKYEEWSQTRLNRLIVDYMLRKGYTKSAALLAEEKGIKDLVDIELFSSAQDIAAALCKGSLTEALAWCSEHKPLLKNLKPQSSQPNLDATASGTASQSASGTTALPAAGRTIPKALNATTAPPPSPTSLEFQLRLQQFVNYINPGIRSEKSPDLIAARAHAAKYLAPHISDPLHHADVMAAGALFVYPPDRPPLQYAGYYSPARWKMLAELFMTTFLELWGLPRDAGLKRALKAGLTALKTPSCHSETMTAASSAAAAAAASATQEGDNNNNNDKNSSEDAPPPGTVPGARLCPICSTELNALARDLPYAHHSQSLVDADPVVLPNDRIYGREKLREFAEKMGVAKGFVKDPVTGKEYSQTEVRKVYIM